LDIAIVGLGHAFEKQINAIRSFENIENIELCDKDEQKIKKYKAKSSYMSLSKKNVLIATSPIYHLEIAKNLIKDKKKIILEKPVVISRNELGELKKIINKDNYYNSLHFSFGLEINYFMKKINKKPIKIYSYISDNYVYKNRIRKNKLGLCGSYLDEVINPLSAISRIFGYNIFFKDVLKKYYKDNEYDYYSKSQFNIEEIPVTIEVLWNDKPSKKYIDLYYENYIIRLDSMKQEVINLTEGKVLFKGSGDRMTNHYIGVFNDYIKNKSNIEQSIKLHEELLKGV